MPDDLSGIYSIDLSCGLLVILWIGKIGKQSLEFETKHQFSARYRLPFIYDLLLNISLSLVDL